MDETTEDRHFGDYQLLEEIASGGMGVVYRALQVRLNRVVALKRIRAGRLAKAEDRARFRAEAEAAARLQHPNIVAIHEVGEQDGQPFFSMDFIEGWSLAQLVSQHPLRPDQAARYVQTIAQAIHYAHQRGVLHRDLKPANIVVDAYDEPHVTDFGLAKVLASDSDLTRSGAVMGSPSYMPPEQAQGRLDEVDARSDGYALGAILYELLTGSPPFRASSAVATLRLVVEQEPVPPRVLNPALPQDLETICLKCLTKSRAGRYATAGQLADELERFLKDEPILARPAGAGEKFRRWCRRQPALAAAIGSSFLLLSVLALVSTGAAIRLKREGEHTQRAKQDAEETLWTSQLDRARAERLSAVAGRRGRSLTAIHAAAQRKPSLELRNEAIATLALTDLGAPLMEWNNTNSLPGIFMAFDARLERYVIVREQGTVTVYRAQDQQMLMELSAPARRPEGVRFSPDGRYLSVGYGQSELVVWNLESGNIVHRTDQRANGSQPAFDTESNRIAVITPQRQIQFFELTGGATLPAIFPGAQPLWVWYGPKAEDLAIGFDDQVQIWNITENRLVQSFQPPSRLTCLDWHPDRRRVALGLASGEVVLWDRVSTQRTIISAHSVEVIRVGFHPGGETLWSTGYDGITRFWDAVNGSPLFSTQEGQARETSQDGARLSFLIWDNSFGLWPVVRSEDFRILQGAEFDQELLNLSLSADGRWLVVGTSVGWRLLETATGREACSVALEKRVRVTLHPDEKSVVGVTLDEVIRWPLTWRTNATEIGAQAGEAETLLSAEGKEMQRLCFSHDGSLLAVAGHRRNVVIDVKHPENAQPFSQGTAESFVSISPDNCWLAAGNVHGVGVTLWDSQTGARIRTLLPKEQAQVGFSPNGKTLVTMTKECVFWDTATWLPRHRVPLKQGPLSDNGFGFTADNRLLGVVEGYQRVKLLDAESGDELATLTPPARLNLVALAISADGGAVAAATQGRTIYFWNLRTLRRELAELRLNWR